MSDEMVTRVLADDLGVALLASVPEFDDRTHRAAMTNRVSLRYLGTGTALLAFTTIHWTEREQTYCAHVSTTLDLPSGQEVAVLTPAMLRRMAIVAGYVHWSGETLASPHRATPELLMTFQVVTGHGRASLPLRVTVFPTSEDDQAILRVVLKPQTE